MKSLMLRPAGADRWWITRHPPSFLGINPMPDERKLWSGGTGNGPARRPASHSFWRESSMTWELRWADGRFELIRDIWGPE